MPGLLKQTVACLHLHTEESLIITDLCIKWHFLHFVVTYIVRCFHVVLLIYWRSNEFRIKSTKESSIKTCKLQEVLGWSESFRFMYFCFICVSAFQHVHCMCSWYPQRPGEGIRSPGTEP